jgi:HD superfamily phosphohydrolase
MPFATVNGHPVPPSLSPQQLQLLFPSGILGLRSTSTGEPIFPSSDGSLRLTAGEYYVTGSQPPTQQTAESEGFGESELPLTEATPKSSPAGRGPFATPQLRLTGQKVLKGKLILDRVHEHIALPPIVAAIVDTAEFQRLRMLKQVGSTFYIYPGACHTRFEHSIGVSHLAGLMVKKIARRQPNLEITDRDVECVMVAGLCHDLGHGPFSHLFERIVESIREERGDSRHYCHEDMSIQLVRRIFEKLDRSIFGWGEDDIRFVELLIRGIPPTAPWPNTVGRDKNKRFLAEIVANKRCGIDVDKLDYFLRDSTCCYGRPTVDCHINRLIASCRAMKGSDGEMQICFEEKMAMSLGDIFALRAKLHKHAYQHRVTRAVDLMFSDALVAADPYFTIRGHRGPQRISEAVDDIDGFCLLGDWIFDAIAASPDPHLAPAQRILQRISCRDLYTFAGTATFRDYTRRVDKQEFLEQLLSCFSPEAKAQLSATIIIDFIAINYGSSDTSGTPDDPIKSVSFFNPKSNSTQAYKLSVTKQSPLFRPQLFGERSIILFVRERQFASAVIAAFDIWRASYSHHLIDAVPVSNVPQSPSANKRARED